MDLMNYSTKRTPHDKYREYAKQRIKSRMAVKKGGEVKLSEKDQIVVEMLHIIDGALINKLLDGTIFRDKADRLLKRWDKYINRIIEENYDKARSTNNHK